METLEERAKIDDVLAVWKAATADYGRMGFLVLGNGPGMPTQWMLDPDGVVRNVDMHTYGASLTPVYIEDIYNAIIKGQFELAVYRASFIGGLEMKRRLVKACGCWKPVPAYKFELII